jgi:hypothetical protein
MVTVTKYTLDDGGGTCVFCTRQGGEMFECAFKDGLRGVLCRACFTRALRLRSIGNGGTAGGGKEGEAAKAGAPAGR